MLMQVFRLKAGICSGMKLIQRRGFGMAVLRKRLPHSKFLNRRTFSRRFDAMMK